MRHFVTLFDNSFLPQGICLHQSLTDHCAAFVLWILCMDQEVEQSLNALRLPNVKTISILEAETPALKRVKAERSRGEYCWTITPFTFDLVFDRSPGIDSVTYVDADLFFFDSPDLIFSELEQSGKDVLITDHAYDPKYDLTKWSGRFCVQFLTVRNTPKAKEVTGWWKEQCIEWCFDKVEPDRFGDQKYLDRWPAMFPDAVHILTKVELALAPWNVRYFARNLGSISPVFYHFHGLRRLGVRRFKLWHYYQVSPWADGLYSAYVAALKDALIRIEGLGTATSRIPERSAGIDLIRRLIWSRTNRLKIIDL